jgi:hypothetical protein
LHAFFRRAAPEGQSAPRKVCPASSPRRGAEIFVDYPQCGMTAFKYPLKLQRTIRFKSKNECFVPPLAATRENKTAYFSYEFENLLEINEIPWTDHDAQQGQVSSRM